MDRTGQTWRINGSLFLVTASAAPFVPTWQHGVWLEDTLGGQRAGEPDKLTEFKGCPWEADHRWERVA